MHIFNTVPSLWKIQTVRPFLSNVEKNRKDFYYNCLRQWKTKPGLRPFSKPENNFPVDRKLGEEARGNDTQLEDSRMMELFFIFRKVLLVFAKLRQFSCHLLVIKLIKNVSL